MRQCKRCKEVKYWFQFYAEGGALYTEGFDICKKCANELKNNAVRVLLKDINKEKTKSNGLFSVFMYFNGVYKKTIKTGCSKKEAEEIKEEANEKYGYDDTFYDIRREQYKKRPPSSK